MTVESDEVKKCVDEYIDEAGVAATLVKETITTSHGSSTAEYDSPDSHAEVTSSIKVIWGSSPRRIFNVLQGQLGTGEQIIVTKEDDDVDSDDMVRVNGVDYRVTLIRTAFWQGAAVFRRVTIRVIP